MKKKYKKGLVLIIIVIIMVIVLIIAYKILKKDPVDNSIKVLDSIDNYSYSLDERDSTLMKNTYNELKKILKEKEIDYEEYAKLLSKLFVIDLFTMSNKVNKYDVGSVEYVYPDAKENFQMNVLDTIYKQIENNNGKRNQELPVVKSVDIISIGTTTFMINEKEYDAYEINLSWTYEKNLGYDDHATINIIKDNEQLYVVSYEVGDQDE